MWPIAWWAIFANGPTGFIKARSLAAAEQEGIEVEVVWAEPGRQWLKVLQLPVGSTLQTAIEASGFEDDIEGFEVSANRVGIFGQKASLDTVLRDGDRVEVYRPLLIDPKEARRLKAETQKKRAKKASQA